MTTTTTTLADDVLVAFIEAYEHHLEAQGESDACDPLDCRCCVSEALGAALTVATNRLAAAAERAALAAA